MLRLIITCGFFVALLSATLCYATNGKPCVISQSDKKQTCKTSERLIPEKLLKIKPINDSKATEKPAPSSTNQIKSPSTADTFETLITPFLKAVSPHFYDQIIKRDQKPAPVQS